MANTRLPEAIRPGIEKEEEFSSYLLALALTLKYDHFTFAGFHTFFTRFDKHLRELRTDPDPPLRRAS